MRKLRLREVRCLAQCHTASQPGWGLELRPQAAGGQSSLLHIMLPGILHSGSHMPGPLCRVAAPRAAGKPSPVLLCACCTCVGKRARGSRCPVSICRVVQGPSLFLCCLGKLTVVLRLTLGVIWRLGASPVLPNPNVMKTLFLWLSQERVTQEGEFGPCYSMLVGSESLF